MGAIERLAACVSLLFLWACGGAAPATQAPLLETHVAPPVATKPPADDVVWLTQRKWFPDYDADLRMTGLVDGDVQEPKTRVLRSGETPKLQLLAPPVPLRVSVGEWSELQYDKQLAAVGTRGRSADVWWAVNTVWVRGVRSGRTTILVALPDGARSQVVVEVLACEKFTEREQRLLQLAETSDNAELVEQAAKIRANRASLPCPGK